MNSYPPLGSDSVPQGFPIGDPFPPPNPLYPVIHSTPSSSYSPWAPLYPYNQGGYPPHQAVQTHGNNTTAFDSNGFAGHQMSLSLEPTPTNTFAPLQQLPISASTDDAHVQSMAPPPKPRKRKAPTLRDDDWEPVKARVIELHITQNVPLPEVKQIVEEESKSIGFTAT
jgi:hypothetical protein